MLSSAAVALILLAAPLVLGTSAYRLGELDYMGSVMMLAISVNIVMGFAGQLTLGPGAVFAVAGYASAYAVDHAPTAIGLPLMCLIGISAALITGLVSGVPALRVGGFYLGMTTLFFALVVPDIATNSSALGGDSGISLISNPDFNPSLTGLTLYEVTMVILLILTGVSALLLRSPLGRQFLTLRASEELVQSVGVPVYRPRLLAFVISAVPAGLGGVFYVYTQQLISPGSVQPQLSILVIAACVVGGLGSISGPIVGCILVFGIQTFFGGLQEYLDIAFGVVLIAFSIGLPKGIAGLELDRITWGPLGGWRRWLTARRSLTGADRTTFANDGPNGEGDTPPLEPPIEVSDQPSARLRVVGASRTFGGVAAVKDVALNVDPGTVHGLIGSNGSGKTTLLNLISGYYRLEQGHVYLDDHIVDGHGPAFVARHRVGRTFQTPKLVDDLTVRDNVLLAVERFAGGSKWAALLHLPKAARLQRQNRALAENCLRFLDLNVVGDRLAGEMPHGTRRLIEIARAVGMRPQHLLLDEPAAGLSIKERERLGRAIRSLADHGVGVLLVEHDTTFVLDLVDELTVLHLGQVVASGRPEHVMQQEVVGRVFLGVAEVEAMAEGEPRGPVVGAVPGLGEL